MKEFKFNGEWEFDLELPVFAKLNSDEWFKLDQDAEHKLKLKQNLIPIKIIGQRNYEPDPSSGQMQTLEYLINNEREILDTLLSVFKSEINPYYAEACGESDWIPNVEDSNDLGLLIGIYTLQILIDDKEGYAYWQLNCEYKGDGEHGLAIVMHKNRMVEYSGIGDICYEGIYIDLGIEQDKIVDMMIANRDFGANMVHKPLSKYNKFKSWQLDATEDYFSDLLRYNKNEKFIEEIKTNNWNINLRFPSLDKNLVDLASYYNNTEMIDYLINQGADFSKSILECTDYYIKKDAIRCLVKNGANIDELNYWKVTPLYNVILSYLNTFSRLNDAKENLSDRIEQLEKELNEYKDKILFYLEMGSNYKHLNGAGEDYKTVIYKNWAEHYIKKHNMVKEIEKLINKKDLL